MNNHFFERPILNSPYEYPTRYWELDAQGQPTQQIIESRRRAEFITPIPKPRKRKGSATQAELVFDEGKGLSTEKQQYDPTSPVINELRVYVISGVIFGIRMTGKSRPTPSGCCSTGVITSLTMFGRSSAKSKLWKPRSG